MKNTSIRYNEQTAQMLSEIDSRPTTAIQTAVEIFTFLRRSTLNELKGIFSKEEIYALADSFNGLFPTWQIMVNPSVLVAHTEDAEKYEQYCSRHGANFEKLIVKLNKLTSAQATILQLELIIFWNNEGKNSYGSPSPDLDKLVKQFI